MQIVFAASITRLCKHVGLMWYSTFVGFRQKKTPIKCLNLSVKFSSYIIKRRRQRSSWAKTCKQTDWDNLSDGLLLGSSSAAASAALHFLPTAFNPFSPRTVSSMCCQVHIVKFPEFFCLRSFCSPEFSSFFFFFPPYSPSFPPFFFLETSAHCFAVEWVQASSCGWRLLHTDHSGSLERI